MQQKIVNILFGVIIIILTGVVVYLTFGNKSTPVTDITLVPTKTTVKPPVVATDETADWKTYTNSQYGFEVKYPQSYVVQNIKDGIIAIKSSTAKELADLNIQINQDPSLNNLDLDSIIQNKLKNFAIRDQQKTTLSGQAAYEGISLGMLSQYALLVKNGNNFFEILFNSGNKDSLAENKATLDTNQKMILSTFKFTDQTSDSATSDWKTYTNSQYGFEFEYPSNWKTLEQSFNPTADLVGKIFITNNKLLSLLDLDTPNRKAEQSELIYSIDIWKTGNSERYQNNINYKNFGIKNGYSVFIVDDFRNSNQNEFNQVLSTFKFTK